MTDRELIESLKAQIDAQLAPAVDPEPVPEPEPEPSPEPEPAPESWPPQTPTAPLTIYPEPRVLKAQQYRESDVVDGPVVRVATMRVAMPREVRSGIIRLDVLTGANGYAGGLFEGIKPLVQNQTAPVWAPTYSAGLDPGRRRESIVADDAEFWTPMFIDLRTVSFGLHRLRIDALMHRVDGRKTNARINVSLWGGAGDGTADPARSGGVLAEGFLTTPGDAPPGSGYFIGANLWGGREHPTDQQTPVTASANLKPGWIGTLRILRNGARVDERQVSVESGIQKFSAALPPLGAEDVIAAELFCASRPEIGSATVVASSGPWIGLAAYANDQPNRR